MFVVDVIERRGYRPASIADVCLTAMSVKDGTLAWETGVFDAQVLAHYQRAVYPADPLRFPSDKDQFQMVSCTADICVEESGSGARWILNFSANE